MFQLSFKIKSLCELIDSDQDNSGKLEISVEDHEMIINSSSPEFVFQKKQTPPEQPPTPSQAQPRDYKVCCPYLTHFRTFYPIWAYFEPRLRFFVTQFNRERKSSESLKIFQCAIKVKARLEVTGGTWVLYSEQNYEGDLAIVTTVSNGRRMSFGQLATVRSARKLNFLDQIEDKN